MKTILIFGATGTVGAYTSLYLKEKGYTNVKMYLDGMPDWEKKNYGEITIEGRGSIDTWPIHNRTPNPIVYYPDAPATYARIRVVIDWLAARYGGVA